MKYKNRGIDIIFRPEDTFLRDVSHAFEVVNSRVIEYAKKNRIAVHLRFENHKFRMDRMTSIDGLMEAYFFATMLFEDHPEKRQIAARIEIGTPTIDVAVADHIIHDLAQHYKSEEKDAA